MIGSTLGSSSSWLCNRSVATNLLFVDKPWVIRDPEDPELPPDEPLVPSPPQEVEEEVEEERVPRADPISFCATTADASPSSEPDADAGEDDDEKQQQQQSGPPPPMSIRVLTPEDQLEADDEAIEAELERQARSWYLQPLAKTGVKDQPKRIEAMYTPDKLDQGVGIVTGNQARQERDRRLVERRKNPPSSSTPTACPGSLPETYPNPNPNSFNPQTSRYGDCALHQY